MSKCITYFQFSLDLLQSAKSTQEVIQDACSLSMLTYGESLDDDVRQQVADEYGGKIPDDDDDCLAIAAGAMRLNVNVGDIAGEAIKARKLRSKHGDGGMQVRLRTDIAWSAQDDDWPLPKMKTLIAIYAGIGDRQMRRMTRLLIRAHGAGFASPKGIKASVLMTDKQVRYWSEKLWMQNLFQMVGDGQDLWYSNRCKNDQELVRIVKMQSAAAKTKTVIQVGDI